MTGHRPRFVRWRTLLAGATAAAAVLVASAAGLASPGAPPIAARDLASTYFSSTLMRAEVVSVVARVVHDYRIDQGKVIVSRPNAIDLRECDGTRQTIPVGRPFGTASIPRGTRVVAVRDGDAPATQIRPSGWASRIGKAFFGATLVRAEILTCSAKTLRDYRIDEGRIVSVRPTSIVLSERDGTRQTIGVGSSTLVTQGGVQSDLSAVTPGLAAVTIREGDGPAQEIRLVALGLTAGRR